jgi:hypothetical protein
MQNDQSNQVEQSEYTPDPEITKSIRASLNAVIRQEVDKILKEYNLIPKEKSGE